MTVSRRRFLKLTGLAAGGLFLPPPPPDEAPPAIRQLGRAVRGLYIYNQPSRQARQLAFLAADTVFNITGSAVDLDDAPNPVWWRVRHGFVASGPVQIVRYEPQIPLAETPAEGFLGEVSVPFTPSRLGPGPQYKFGYRFYYGTTHWITRAATDAAGQRWYGILGDRTKALNWVPAEHLRPLTPEDLTPIAPEVADKRIVVSLTHQTFKCYENGQLVLDTPCSTGVPLRREDGQVIYGTPTGDWQVIRKRPSRHMAGDDLAAADFFDLPGVPWVTYIHWWGIAIHGAYWHNDFGIPRSHGCINLPNEVAKWVYRWTTPAVPYERVELEARGTAVTVEY